MSVATSPERAGKPASGEKRIVELDGFRGFLSILVVVSHYFGEVKHPVPGMSLGWLSVILFFVLSGFLVGRIILEKGASGNFFTVFYMRRACRILPLYVFWTLLVFLLLAVLGDAPWIERRQAQIPLWAYLTFTQNVFMAAANDLGLKWISQSWSLGIEEQFYLVAPILILLTPRRYLMHALVACVATSVVFRALVFSLDWNATIAQVTLPGRADSLCLGIIAALLYGNKALLTPRLVAVARVVPVVMLPIAGLLLYLLLRHGQLFLFQVFVPLVVALAGAAFVLALACGAPEGMRFRNALLRFFGRISYPVFLTHLGVSALLHGLVLGTAPDLGSPAQWAVTVLAIPATIIVSWGLMKLLQDPIVAYGRQWSWSPGRRQAAPAAGLTLPQPAAS